MVTMVLFAPFQQQYPVIFGALAVQDVYGSMEHATLAFDRFDYQMATPPQDV